LRTGERSERRGEGPDFGMIDARKFPRSGVGDDASIFEKDDAGGEEQRSRRSWVTKTMVLARRRARALNSR